MTNKTPAIAYLGLDIETTGLEPEHDQILEISWRAVDHTFAEIEGEFFSRVFALSASGLVRLSTGPEVVRTMHSHSGLLGEVLGSRDEVSPAVNQLESALLRLHEKYERVHLLGMSIHFDAEFLKEHGFGRVFNDKRGIHHRMYDVTSIKLALAQAGVEFEPAPKGNHRALNDVDEAIAQAAIFSRLFARLSA